MCLECFKLSSFMIREYKFGTHPFEMDAWPVSAGFDQGLYITYPDVEPRDDLMLEVSSTTNLVSGVWSADGVAVTNVGAHGNATLKTGRVPADDPERFLSLDVIGE